METQTQKQDYEIQLFITGHLFADPLIVLTHSFAAVWLIFTLSVFLEILYEWYDDGSNNDVTIVNVMFKMIKLLYSEKYTDSGSYSYSWSK